MRILLALDSDEAGQRATMDHIESIADFRASWGIPRSPGPTAQALATAQLAYDDAQAHYLSVVALHERVLDPETPTPPSLLHARREAEAMLETIGIHITDLYKQLFSDRPYLRAKTAEEYELIIDPPRPMYDATRIDWDGIKNRIDLVDWVTRVTGQDYVPRGNAYKGICPLPTHTEKTPSFHIYPEPKNWYCYGCHEWGDIFDLAKALNLNVRDL